MVLAARTTVRMSFRCESCGQRNHRSKLLTVETTQKLSYGAAFNKVRDLADEWEPDNKVCIRCGHDNG